VTQLKLCSNLNWKGLFVVRRKINQTILGLSQTVPRESLEVQGQPAQPQLRPSVCTVKKKSPPEFFYQAICLHLHSTEWHCEIEWISFSEIRKRKITSHTYLFVYISDKRDLHFWGWGSWGWGDSQTLRLRRELHNKIINQNVGS
jgi:hypothetical protein